MVGIKSLKEVPKNCIECPYGIYLGSISFCLILEDDEIDIQENMLKGTRYEYCPLTEIEERKEGKWKSDGHGHIFCTACNEVNVSLWKSKYCPCCSAEMRGAENE